MKQNKLWNMAKDQAELKQALGQALQVPEEIAGVLINRGFKDNEAAEKFLHAEKQDFFDPFLLKDMERAAGRIQTAILGNEKIMVYGDYDVDGITSTALLVRVLQDLGAQVSYYIPERQNEGYGLNCNALKEIIAEGTRLILTVDCGISAFEEAKCVNGGVDLIITDHHRPPEVLPEAFAIVNPKRVDCAYPDKNLAGVGVAYKLCQALWRLLKGEEFTKYLEIAAFGTVADIVPLLGENRLIVKRGLEQMKDSSVLGLQALIRSAGLADKKVDAGRVGFTLAPRLNATGRLSSALIGVKLLLTENQDEADSLAEQLEIGNMERQRIEKEVLQKVEGKLHEIDIAAERVLVVAGEGWHTGVIGIVASRIVDQYYKPAIIISIEQGVGKGSCRSIRGFDIYDALTQCADLLEQFGGHAQAAGLTILPENIVALRERLSKIAAETLSQEDYIPVLNVEAMVDLHVVDLDFLTHLERLEPYGMGNPRPTFASSSVEFCDLRTMGQDRNHLRFNVRQEGQTIGALAWGMGALADELRAEGRGDIAFQPEINEWQGRRSVQLKAQDFRSHEKILTELDQLYLAEHAPMPYQAIEQSQQFFTKAVGVTFENRQAVIAELTAGERLLLKRQPNNVYDANAILICTETMREIGFLKAEIAQHLAPCIDSGTNYEAQVMTITGTMEQNFGVNILVFKEIALLFSERKHKQIDLDVVRKALIGDRAYHQSQIDALTSLAAGTNSLVIMGTGRGKSAIFQSHAAMLAINHRKMTIILYPLRALVNDQYIGLRRMMEPLGITVYKGNGTLAASERGNLFEALQGGTVDILLTTPEFLEANFSLLHISENKVAFVVVDECHHIADANRRPAYKNLHRLIARLGNPLILGVTATANDETYTLIREALSIEHAIIDRTVRKNLTVVDSRRETDKFIYLKSLLRKDEKVLIFVNSRSKTAEIAEALREACPKFSDQIGFYHAGMSNEWRVKVEDWFRNGALNVVIATSAFGEGIDLPDIRHVVQYHLPFDMTTFNQQCGRAGRDGKKSFVHFLFGKDDIKLNQLILKERSPERDVIAKIYLTLKANRQAENKIVLTNGAIAALYVKQYRQFIGESGVSACLKILEELNLISRETFHAMRTIYFQAAPSVKLDLMQSSSYAEGIDERAEFSFFSAEAMAAESEKLLHWINRPIYPESEVQYNGVEEE